MKTKFGTATLNNHGYYRIISGKEGNNGRLLHRLIWEDWYGKPVPKGCQIHHLNEIKTDNRIQNLQCVERSAHMRFHKGNEKAPLLGLFGEEHPRYGKPHSEETRKRLSKLKNTTGIMNVSKEVSPRSKQGFRWLYQYYENGKKHRIYRVDLKELEAEVKRRGLKWEQI